MMATRPAHLSGPLQARLYAAQAGEIIELPAGEYEGPITIRRAVTLSGGSRATIWAQRGPVVTVAAPGVVLRGLHVEVTELACHPRDDGDCALDLRAAPDLVAEQVSVAGTVAGPAEEQGPWSYPSWLDLGEVEASDEAGGQPSFQVTVPVPCSVASAIRGLTVEPSELPPGTHELRLYLDRASAGGEIRGELALTTRLVSRKIAVMGRISSLAFATVPASTAVPALAAALARRVQPSLAVVPAQPEVPLPAEPRREEKQPDATAAERRPGSKRWALVAAIVPLAILLYFVMASFRRTGPEDLKRLAPLPPIEAAADPDAALALAPDGSALARGSSKNGLVELFDSRTGGKWKWQKGSPDDPSVRAVAFSWDGRTLASGGGAAKVSLWDTEQGRPLGELRGVRDVVTALSFSPDGAMLAAGEQGGRLRLWERGANAPWPAEAQWTSPEPERHAGEVLALAFSADGHWLASGGQDERVFLWDTHNHVRLAPFRGFAGSAVESLAVNAEGTSFAAGLSDHMVRLWDRAETQPRLSQSAGSTTVRAVWLSRDARFLISAAENLEVQLWDATQTGSLRAKLAAPSKSAKAVAISRDGKTLASVNQDGTLSAWRGE